MSVPAQKPLTVDDFLAWAEPRPGVSELHHGVPVAMSPERALHTQVKTEAAVALREAIRRAGSPCHAFTAGITVRIRETQAFVPDALVVCPPPPPDAETIDNPLIVVEVLSPSTAGVDHGLKLESYFELASVAHYLILDLDRRGADFIETRILTDGVLKLTPPGLELPLSDLFGPAP